LRSLLTRQAEPPHPAGRPSLPGSAPARWPRAASAETAAQLLGGRSEWVQPPGTGIQLPVAPTALQRPTGRSHNGHGV